MHKRYENVFQSAINSAYAYALVHYNLVRLPRKRKKALKTRFL